MAFKSLIRNANKDRVGHKDSFWNDKKKNFVIGVTSSFVLIQLLFLGVMSYLYGAVYQESTRISSLNVLMVDYDSSVIGESLRQAVTTLSSESFPTISERTTSDYPTEQDVVNAVYRAHYWAAIFTTTGASQRLTEAITSGAAYDASNAITYVYNEARYPTVESGYILANLQQLVSAAGGAYHAINGTYALQAVDSASESARQALFNPIGASSINIKPTPQGSKVLYNTISMVVPIIMQFFFLMAVNGISNHFAVYSHLPLKENGMIRLLLSTLYTFIGALCTAGYQHAFQESEWLTAGQFVLVWMILWLYMHINFLVIDCATAFIPTSFLSFFFFTWVIFNVTSVLFPFELNPGFYRWGYALPSHEVYQVLVTIWSGGATNQLHISLPILFAWEVVLYPLSILALHYRCAYAAREHQANEEAMRDKYASHNTGEPIRREKTRTRGESLNGGVIASPAPQTPGVGNGYFPSTPVPFQYALERFTSSRGAEQA